MTPALDTREQASWRDTWMHTRMQRYGRLSPLMVKSQRKDDPLRCVARIERAASAFGGSCTLETHGPI